MKKSANEIRSEFVNFFKERNHNFVPSAPVIPSDDPTLLFTNAGMNQFKSIFLGENRDNLKRAANSQKCMRVSGKHNDLEEVGVDHHHHTFFEMLGNWSFGDYYKKEAISWAWELITDVWGLPKDKLYATVYTEDDESMEIWKSVTDIDHSRIGKHGAKDNFWEMGDTGPCGPCSEIHIDCGPGTCVNEGVEGHVCDVNADGCGRFMEIWNLVFIQYNRNKDGSLAELPNKHVDTGMGFERILRILQGVKSNYDTDLFMPIILETERMSGKSYDPGPEGTPFRVIADHIRALVFAISDGALPSNEGRGYVLRRILRRAYRFGNKLGFKEPFLYKLVSIVSKNMGEAFPEVAARKDHVAKIIESEEQRFGQTLEQGLEKLNQAIEKSKQSGLEKLSGKDVFTLYDTFGFPMDLTRLIASEEAISIDEEGFKSEMESQRQRARDAQKSGSDDGLSSEGWIEIAESNQTEFTGYGTLTDIVNVTRYKVLKSNDSDQCVEALIVLERSPFYPEMGGQVGDKGILTLDGAVEVRVTNTIKWNDTTVHKVSSEAGFPISLLENKGIKAQVSTTDRIYTARNHSATHLLQSALMQVLGDHVTQSGSRVDPKGLRFDFTHFKALETEELKKVETLVNSWILEDYKVTTEVKNTEDAKKDGATALFGEKYGDTVRVVTMGEMSSELCGGTHVKRTGNIGLLHITSESSISAGVRRIEAVTGMNTLALLSQKEDLLDNICLKLKVNESKLEDRIDDLGAKVKELENKVSELAGGQAENKVEELLKTANENETNGVQWATADLGSLDKDAFAAVMDSISDNIKQKRLEQTVIAIAAEVNGKALFAACAGSKCLKEKSIHCGELVKSAASIAGGGGGGNPVRAQAGGKDPSKIAEALVKVNEIIKEKAGA